MRSPRAPTAAAAATRRRGSVRKADGERRVGRAIEARRGLSIRRGERTWINGDEVGGSDPRYLSTSD